jgi:hypothetical protein
MKKAIGKKLLLNKETIVNLGKNQQDSVKGGTIFVTAASCMEPPQSRCICKVTVTGCPPTD